MLIDTTNLQEMQKFERLKEELIKKKLEKGKYDSTDIALVRVTDHLPVEGRVPSFSNVPFVTKINDLAHEVMTSIFEDQGLSYDEYKQMAREMSPLSTQSRSSVHFCLNGFVSSSIYGKFEGNPFVIIEPFKHHENDSNILAVRGEDTYFQDWLTLSDEAIILVDENYADKVLDSGIDPNKIVFYRGNQKQACDVMLTKMGIVPEIVGQDYILDSSTSEYIRNFINEKNYPRDKHCFSESYRKDDQNNLKLWEKYAEDYYTYLYSNVYGDIESKKEEIAFLTSADQFNSKAIELLKGVINAIGLEKYKEIVDSYNNAILEKVTAGNYPTNNQILSGAQFGYSVSVSKK